jgi:hypothetical protein
MILGMERHLLFGGATGALCGVSFWVALASCAAARFATDVSVRIQARKSIVEAHEQEQDRTIFIADEITDQSL